MDVPMSGAQCTSIAFVVTTLSIGLGCGTRDKAPPPPPRSTDAAAQAPPENADKDGLGPYDAVRVRFERDCPPNLPRSSASDSLPGLEIHSTGRACQRVVRGHGQGTVRRRVSLNHKKDDSQPSESTSMPIARVDISYKWSPTTAGVSVPECSSVAEEVAAYLRDLTGATSQHAQRAAIAMRAHHGQRVRFVTMDHEVCAATFDLGASGDDAESNCGAMIAACYLFRNMPPPAIDVDLTSIPSDAGASPAHKLPNEGVSDGRF